MSRPKDHDPAVATRSDAELLSATRAGSATAYSELWRRHYRAALVVARSFTATFDPDDLVSESFARIYATIARGGGPTTGFRPYLFTTIRNTARGWGRASREITIENPDVFEDERFSEEGQLHSLNKSLAAQAFRTLPEAWQEVLWYTEVESMPPRDVAPLLGMTPNAVAALAYRAREGLRASWIQTHLATVPEHSEHRWAIEHLGARLRGRLTKNAQRRLDEHLEGCLDCTLISEEASEANRHIGFVLLPLIAGVGGAAAYTSWLSTASAAPASAETLGVAGNGTHAASAHGATHGAAAVALITAAAAVAASVVATALAIAPPRPIEISPVAGGIQPPRASAAPNRPQPSVPTPPPSPGPSSAPSPAPSPEPSPAVRSRVAAPAPAETTAELATSAPLPPISVPGAPVSAPLLAPPTILASTVDAPADALQLTGTAAPGATVDITIAAGAGAARLSARAVSSASGGWTATLDVSALADGTYAVSAVASLGAHTSLPSSTSVSLKRPPGSPQITLIDAGDGRLFPILRGTAIPGAEVAVTAGGSTSTATADASGDWVLELDRGVVAGSNAIGVRQQADGMTSPEVETTIALHAPAVSTTVRAGTEVVTVSGDPGATISVAAGDGAWQSEVLDSDGDFVAQFPAGPPSRLTVVSVRYADAGREGLLVISTLPADLTGQGGPSVPAAASDG